MPPLGLSAFMGPLMSMTYTCEFLPNKQYAAIPHMSKSDSKGVFCTLKTDESLVVVLESLSTPKLLISVVLHEPTSMFSVRQLALWLIGIPMQKPLGSYRSTCP